MKKISSEELKIKIGNNEKLVILDVRELDGYKEGHIDNSIFLPMSQVAHQIENLVEEKDTMICVYCYSGVRSSRVCNLLEYLDYTNVYNLGSIENWNYGLSR